jgi:hypothetical protein|nr:MAG TPA: hypothetical protein [Caudoviricetes sp.]
MKCKVIKRFNDKNTKEFYKLNQVIEVSEERYKEIKQFVNLFEETVKKSDRRKGKELEENV